MGIGRVGEHEGEVGGQEGKDSAPAACGKTVALSLGTVLYTHGLNYLISPNCCTFINH